MSNHFVLNYLTWQVLEIKTKKNHAHYTYLNLFNNENKQCAKSLLLLLHVEERQYEFQPFSFCRARNKRNYNLKKNVKEINNTPF